MVKGLMVSSIFLGLLQQKFSEIEFSAGLYQLFKI
jgi:hypothetical protein